MDTARADHFSLNGYARATTPGIDRLAQQAAVFHSALSPAPWTPPAHASILTGLLPAVHGTDGDFLSFAPPGPSLPEILQQAGYATGAVVNNPLLPPNAGWSRGFDRFHTPWTYPARSLARILQKIQSRDENAQWHGRTPRSLQAARRWWAGIRDRPRFLFINLIDPHSPYGEQHAYRDAFLDESMTGGDDLPDESELYDAGLVRAEGPALARLIARYDGDIRHMDACLDAFFGWLDRRRELDTTLVVLTSDHGERLGELGLLGHQLGLDQKLLHVPLLVRLPARVEPGSHSSPVQTHGIFATILETVGVPGPDDGLPRIVALHQQELDVTVGQMRQQSWYLEDVRRLNESLDTSTIAGDWMTVSDGTWKLWRSNQGGVRLHHVLQDPAEEIDVAAGNPEIVERLARQLVRLPRFERGETAPEPGEEARELLRILGYIR